MKKINYIYILIGLLIILCILYINYFNNINVNIINNNIKDEKQYFLDKKPDIINNINTTKLNKF